MCASKSSQKSIFALDFRSLALVRIILGMTLFFDLWTRFKYLDVFFTDYGTLPRWVLLKEFELNWKLSLLVLNGTTLYAVILCFIGFIASIGLILGWRTRVCTFIGWVLLLSFHGRHPEVIHGGDNLLRMIFFYSLFLPLNAKYSFDSTLGRLTGEYKDPANPEMKSGFTFAWIAQICFIYFFTFFYKKHPIWLKDGTALYYALNVDVFATPFGKALLQFPTALKGMTFSTIALEGLGPFSILIPWKRDQLRILAVFLFLLLHVGIAATLHLGVFPIACIMVWLALLPPLFWESIERKLNSLSTRGRGLTLFYDKECGFCRKAVHLLRDALFLNGLEIQTAQDHAKANELMTKNRSWILFSGSNKSGLHGFAVFAQLLKASWIFAPVGWICSLPGLRAIGNFFYTLISRRRKLWGITFNKLGTSSISTEKSRTSHVLGISFCVLILLWNLEGITKTVFPYIGAPLRGIVFLFQLNQEWNMFAPYPMKGDGWYVVDAETRNGIKWDIWNNIPVSFEKPKDFTPYYPNAMVSKYLLHLSKPDLDKDYLLFFGKFLCRNWNTHQPDPLKVDHFKLYFMLELTPEPGHELPIPEKEEVWDHHCYQSND